MRAAARATRPLGSTVISAGPAARSWRKTRGSGVRLTIWGSGWFASIGREAYTTTRSRQGFARLRSPAHLRSLDQREPALVADLRIDLQRHQALTTEPSPPRL